MSPVRYLSYSDSHLGGSPSPDSSASSSSSRRIDKKKSQTFNLKFWGKKKPSKNVVEEAMLLEAESVETKNAEEAMPLEAKSDETKNAEEATPTKEELQNIASLGMLNFAMLIDAFNKLENMAYYFKTKEPFAWEEDGTMHRMSTWKGGDVLVKRFFSLPSKKENFLKELRIVSLLRHPNILKSIGWCSEGDEHLIIYELPDSVRALDSILGYADQTLSWNMRYRISIQLAKAIYYMHKCGVLHGDIRPANVLLDSYFDAKLFSFHCCCVLPDVITKASDIFSLGVLLLQLVTGISTEKMRNMSINRREGYCSVLPNWVFKMYMNGGIHEVADRRLKGSFKIREMERLILAGLYCTRPHGESRPSAREVFLYIMHGPPPFATSNTGKPIPMVELREAHVAGRNGGAIPRQNASTPSSYPYGSPKITEFNDEPNLKKFSYDQLRKATEYFHHKNIIWTGGSHIVYRGYLQDMNIPVAVKMVHAASREEHVMSFESEVQALRSVDHQCIVKLVGICLMGWEYLIVYEHMSNGSLFSRLHSGNGSLPWEARYRIAWDLALAILYIHEECAIFHTNITSTNVLLGEETTKLTGFEAATPIMNENVDTMVSRTVECLDPEFLRTGKFTKASDIYSLGAVMLEIASGMTVVDVDEEGIPFFMIDKVWDLYERGVVMEAADKRLGGKFSIQDMERLLLVGLSCTQKLSDLRPSIKQVVDALNSKEPLSHLIVNAESSLSNPSPASGIQYTDTPAHNELKLLNQSDPDTLNALQKIVGSSIPESDDFMNSDINVVELKEERDKMLVGTADKGTDDPVLLLEKQNQMINEEETFNIGIPPNYHFNGQLDEFQLTFLKACINVLSGKLKAGAKFDDVLSTIKGCTTTLVTLPAPLDDWISLTKDVLRSLKVIESLKALCRKEVYPTSNLSSLKEEMDRQITKINEDDEEIANRVEFIESAEQERASLSNLLRNLQTQIADIQKKFKDVENELSSNRESLKAAEGRRVQRLEVLDSTKAEYSILSIYDSMLSRLSSFGCG